MRSRTVSTLITALALGCGGGGRGVPGDKAPDTPDVADVGADTPETQHLPDILETPEDTAPKPFLSARKVEKATDLTTGDNAYGRVGGSYVIENSKVRFVIQDKGVAAHLFIYGGNLIDADLHRGPGEDGNDQFREMFPIVGMRAATADKVEVVKDGSDGEEAVIRVTGEDAPTGIVPMLDQLAQPLGVTISTEYVLAPDVPYITLRTEVLNPGDAPKKDLLVGDFLAFGGGSRIMTPETGFTGTPMIASVIASSGRGASYAYASAGETTVPLVDASGTAGVLNTAFEVPAKGKAQFERWFIVGRGDIASAVNIARGLREDKTQTISGKVTDDKGAPATGALVTAFAEGKATASGLVVGQASVGCDIEPARYAMRLPPGKYDIVFSAPGRNRVILPSVDLASKDQALDQTLAPAARVEVNVKELGADGETLNLMPAKISLYCKEGAEEPWDELGEAERHGLCKALFTASGFDEFPVKPGHYKAVVSRGIEFETETIDDLLVEAGKTATLQAKLQRTLDTTGYLSGDFHQHTIGSLDTPLTHEEKVIENLAEGVEVPSVTDHDNITSYLPAIAKLGVSKWINGVTGDEVGVTAVGHFNMFAPEGSAEDLFQYIGAKFYSGRTVPELFAAMRKVPGVKVIQINHPRGGENGYFNFIKLDPTTGKALSLEQVFAGDFDTVEVKDALGEPSQYLPSADENMHQMAAAGTGDIPTMRDWFGLLNTGKNACAVGDSDAHGRNAGVGYARNYLHLGTDDPADATPGKVLEALLAQKVVVSNGPFIRLTVKGEERMGHTEPIKLDAGRNGELLVHVKVLAAAWIDVTRMEVYANGRPVFLKNFDGALVQDENETDEKDIVTALPIVKDGQPATVRADMDVTLIPKVDTWYVLVVRGDKGIEPVGNGTPFAYTNPLYVDVDGGGFKAIWE